MFKPPKQSESLSVILHFYNSKRNKKWSKLSRGWRILTFTSGSYNSHNAAPCYNFVRPDEWPQLPLSYTHGFIAGSTEISDMPWSHRKILQNPFQSLRVKQEKCSLCKIIFRQEIPNIYYLVYLSLYIVMDGLHARCLGILLPVHWMTGINLFITWLKSKKDTRNAQKCGQIIALIISLDLFRVWDGLLLILMSFSCLGHPNGEFWIDCNFKMHTRDFI